MNCYNLSSKLSRLPTELPRRTPYRKSINFTLTISIPSMRRHQGHEQSSPTTTTFHRQALNPAPYSSCHRRAYQQPLNTLYLSPPIHTYIWWLLLNLQVEPSHDTNAHFRWLRFRRRFETHFSLESASYQCESIENVILKPFHSI